VRLVLRRPKRRSIGQHIRFEVQDAGGSDFCRRGGLATYTSLVGYGSAEKKTRSGGGFIDGARATTFGELAFHAAIARSKVPCSQQVGLRFSRGF